MNKTVIPVILGAVLLSGAAIGAGAGLLGGYLYDQYEKSQGRP